MVELQEWYLKVKKKHQEKGRGESEENTLHLCLDFLFSLILWKDANIDSYVLHFTLLFFNSFILDSSRQKKKVWTLGTPVVAQHSCI